MDKICCPDLPMERSCRLSLGTQPGAGAHACSGRDNLRANLWGRLAVRAERSSMDPQLFPALRLSR